MSYVDVAGSWETTKDHVDNILGQCDNYEQMVKFSDLMCNHYKLSGCTDKDVQELRLLIGARCLHYALDLKIKKDEITNELKKVVFEPGKEVCVVIPKEDEIRVLGMIDDRNKLIIPDEKRVRQHRRGRIKYKVVR